MLKLKQQLLQLAMRNTEAEFKVTHAARLVVEERMQRYRTLLDESTGIDMHAVSTPTEVIKGTENIGGVNVPFFKEASFSEIKYSFFATPVWIDAVVKDLRELAELKAKDDVLEVRYNILAKELARTLQRVNLFEKVKIPEAKEAIRRIRIKLGDEMAAAVARAKAAKAKTEAAA